jgi:hypothetical protein
MHKRSRDRKKWNYKKDVPYISGTPIKKSQKQTPPNRGTLIISFLEGRFSASRHLEKTTNPTLKDVNRL